MNDEHANGTYTAEQDERLVTHTPVCRLFAVAFDRSTLSLPDATVR